VNAEYRTPRGGKLIRIDRPFFRSTVVPGSRRSTCIALYKTEQNFVPDSYIILGMPNTSERGEIAGRANAKEAEVVQQSKKLSAKTRQASARLDAKNKLRSLDAPKGQPRNLPRTP